MNLDSQHPRPRQPGHAERDTFDLDDPRYIVLPGLMWAACIAAALLGPPGAPTHDELASPVPQAICSLWAA